MGDLAKFGRDALNFLNGDAIKAMADAEVGQFLILLARASGVAGASAVSTLVPAAPVFRQVESRLSVKTADKPQPLPSVSDLQRASVPHGSGDFKNIAARFRRAFGLPLSHGKLAKQSYAQACISYSEEFVLAEFENWQKSNGWMREKGFTHLYQFYESLASASEATKLIQADAEQVTQKKEKEESAKEDAIEAGRAETLKKAIARQHKKRADEMAAKQAVENPEALFS